MEDSWDSQIMMGVGMGDLRGMGQQQQQQQQPSCSRQEMHQEINIASPEQQELHHQHHQHHHHQDVMAQQGEYFGNQVSLCGDATSGKKGGRKIMLIIIVKAISEKVLRRHRQL